METRQIFHDCRQMETAESAGREQIETLKKSYRFDRLDDLSSVLNKMLSHAFMLGFRQGVKQCCQSPSVDIPEAKPDK